MLLLWTEHPGPSLPKVLSILRILNSESRFSILQFVWNRIETRVENEELCITGCLMLLPIQSELSYHENLDTLCAQG